MKKILIILFLLTSFLGFSQSSQKNVLDSLNILLPNGKQLTPQTVKKALELVIKKNEVLAKPKTVLVANSEEKNNDLVSPHNKTGGLAKNVMLKYWRVQNATSFEIVLSKNPSLTSPTSYTTTSANYQITGLDTNQVYYWKVRGKNSSVNGAWSNVKRFDTYPIPSNCSSSIFDLAIYIPLVTKLEPLFAVNQDLPINQKLNTYFIVGNKQIFARKFTGIVTSFPFTLTSGYSVDQIIKIDEVLSGIVTYPAWTGREPEQIDLRAYVTNNSGTLMINPPVTTFPIVSVDLRLGIYFTLN